MFWRRLSPPYLSLPLDTWWFFWSSSFRYPSGELQSISLPLEITLGRNIATFSKNKGGHPFLFNYVKGGVRKSKRRGGGTARLHTAVTFIISVISQLIETNRFTIKMDENSTKWSSSIKLIKIRIGWQNHLLLFQRDGRLLNARIHLFIKQISGLYMLIFVWRVTVFFLI
jgi:hypothetical protein